MHDHLPVAAVLGNVGAVASAAVQHVPERALGEMDEKHDQK